jgi:hypothetical protein
MNYGHRAGSSISFVDSFSDEILLKLEAELENGDLFSYRLYDKMGALIANVDGVSAVPDGIQIRSSEGELLLGVSPEIGSGSSIACIPVRVPSSRVLTECGHRSSAAC